MSDKQDDSDLSISTSQLRDYFDCVWDLCSLFSAATDVDSTHRLTCFHSVCVPNISIADYCINICRKLTYDKATILVSLVLVERYWRRGVCHPSKLAVHRLFATSLLIASKLRFDHVWRNSHFARVCGLHVAELNALEGQFLQCLDYTIYVCDVDVLALTTSLDGALCNQRLSNVALAFGLNFLPATPSRTGTLGEATSSLLASLSTNSRYTAASDPALSTSVVSVRSAAGSGIRAAAELRRVPKEESRDDLDRP
jgi:hypothetical protein